MNYSKPLITMTVAIGAALGAVAASPAAMAATPQPGLTTGSVAHSATGGVTPAATNRGSFNCTSPAGEHLNVSWSPGETDVNVFYNNHCSQSRKIKVAISAFPDACFTAPAMTKGSHRVSFPVTSHVQTVTSPC